MPAGRDGEGGGNAGSGALWGDVVDWGSRGYRGELESDPREAMEAYVDLLQKDDGMTLLNSMPGEEDYR